MFFEWLSREFSAILSWWLLVTLAGVAVFPFLFRWFGALPSRGYALARTAGLLLIGFFYWIGGVLGVLKNTGGAVALVWVGVFSAALYAYATLRPRRDAEDGEPLGAWLRKNLSLVLTTEALFFGLFFLWAVVRALNPDLTGTEKPMEMAFLNAVRRADAFPPPDPWMSGYAISYYHFGYILMGTLANLSGIGSGIAFNLAVCLIFALVSLGAFGVVYDLVMLRRGDPEPIEADDPPPARPHKRNALAAGVLAIFFTAMMGNFGMTMIEIPLQFGIVGNDNLQFMDILHRPNTERCPATGTTDVDQWCSYWWWAYSRVVYDRNLDGTGNEIITEFPQFSFILSDLHPHVLSMPFVMLVIALALNLVMLKRRPKGWEIALYTIFVGGMVFLNSWDAVFLVVFIGVEALRRLIWSGTGKLSGDDLLGIGWFGVRLFLLTGVFYAPFFLFFRSQAGGFFPNVIWTTRVQQYIMMFAPFLLLLPVYLLVEIGRVRRSFNERFAIQTAFTGIMGMAVVAVLLGVVAYLNDDIRTWVFRIVDQSGGIGQALSDVASRRLQGLPTFLIIGTILVAVVGRLFPREHPQARRIITYSPATGVALFLIGVGAALTLIPEFIYLKDGFGTRINMLFKFYYQAWLVWSVAAAYICWSVISEPHVGGRIVRVGFAGLLTFVIVTGALYPYFAIQTRALKEGGHLGGYVTTMTLDGAPSLASTPDDYAVIQCLAQAATSPKDVVAEATKRGLAYNKEYGRVAALTGIPTLLGWDNHENQWRGSTFAAANTLTYTDANGVPQIEDRYTAVATLYNTPDVKTAMDIVKRYGITYIYVGPTEQREFTAEGLAKFASLPPVCASGRAAVYSADALGVLLKTAGN